jgi:response regulator RpfG family c-di-GMP phosphodiesterase
MAGQMRQHPHLAGAKIIGASATVSDSTNKEAFADVCDDFLVKPIDIDLLLDKIRMHLQIVWETAQVRTSEASRQRERESHQEMIEMPPISALRELHDLGLMGDMRRIQDWADQLESTDGKFKPFADKLRELAAGFKTKAILSLIERHAGELL